MWPLRPVSPPLSTIQPTLDCRPVAVKTGFLQATVYTEKNIYFHIQSHKKMLWCFFPLIHNLETLKSKTRLWKHDRGNTWFSSNHPQNSFTATSTWELFSFRPFEQIENSFADKTRRCRVNGQQAARPRIHIIAVSSLLHASLFVWSGSTTTHSSSTDWKQFVHTEPSTWLNIKIQTM